MKPIIAITFLITLMLMGTPMLSDTLTHKGSGKSSAATNLTTGTQGTEKSNPTDNKPRVQSAQMQQENNEIPGTLSGKNTANLIIIL